MKSILALCAACFLLAGCGQTGPLYLPTPPAKPAPAQASPDPALQSTPAPEQ